MSWFGPKSKKHPQEMRVPKLRFLGEQDGPSECELKERLVEFFRRDRSVQAAYLARVTYGDEAEANVALCLRTQFGPDRGLAEKVGTIFKTLFNAQVHLDIIFPSAAQQSELTQVCKPFFESTESA